MGKLAGQDQDHSEITQGGRVLNSLLLTDSGLDTLNLKVSQMLVKETETVSRTMDRNLRMMQKNNILKISITKIEKDLKKLG